MTEALELFSCFEAAALDTIPFGTFGRNHSCPFGESPMPSPFPGMNPYLEQGIVWQDFHQSFIPAAREALGPQLGEGYIVKVEEYVFIHELGADARQSIGRADVLVSKGSRNQNSVVAIASAAPAYVSVPSLAVIEERHSFLEIRDRQNLDLVTVIELLSPSNKSGDD